MFSNCTNIKISQTQTSEYQTEYRIPTSGTGTDVNNALSNMFAGTGGTFKGTPTINTTYYTSNEVIGDNKPEEPEQPEEDLSYLTFSSPSEFTVSSSLGKSWDGTLEYSIDTNAWNV
jgi:hypothetical protein